MHECPHCHRSLTTEQLAAAACPHCGRAYSVEGDPDDSRQTFISDSYDEPAAPPEDQEAAVTDSSQTFISDSFDDPEAENTGETDQTFISDDFEPPVTLDEDSDAVGETDQTFISDELDVDERLKRSLERDWAGAEGGDAKPSTSIKARERIAGQPSSTLVIKHKVFHSVDVKPGDEAAEYELLDVLGKGGMGVVYEARQTSIDRAVAIKMLDAQLADGAKNRQKFLAEAVVTGELDHPNVVPIYDVGINDKGTLFYSMKKVQGTPWSQKIKTTSLADNLSILLRVADAVAFAHARGVVHRDIKPENVMLGEYGEVLVMDWGLAQPTPEFRKAQSIADIRTMGGTPCYMAPEMVLGPVSKIDRRSDIYLLGATLYEILTTKPPHVASKVSECLILAGKNVIAETDKKGELIDIARKAMATKPDERYATVQDFQAAIREYQSHTESIALSALADSHLNQAIKSEDYQTFAKALFGFEEAVTLWSGNATAKAGASRARMNYGECAIRKGDLELADSLLDANVAEHAELRAELARKQAERIAHQKRLNRAKRLVQGLAAAIFLIVTVAFFWILNAERHARIARDDAIAAQVLEKEAKEEAIGARKQEEAAKNDAIAARVQEEQAKNDAIAARQQEEVAKNEAVVAKNVAVDEQRKAEIARAAAVSAREAEEYEAYIARIGLAAAKIDENAFDSARSLLEACPPHLRQWEWGRLMFLCSQSERNYRADFPINALSISPDNTRFATGGWNGSASVWNMETGQVEFSLPHGGQEIYAVAYSPDGRYIATAGDNSTSAIRLWSAATGEPVAVTFGDQAASDAFAARHTDAVVSLQFSHDGNRLLSGSLDSTARVWDVASGAQLCRLYGHNWWVWAASFAPERDAEGKLIPATRIVTASQDGTAIVWTDETGRWNNPTDIVQGVPFRGHEGPVYAAVFTPDAHSVVTAGYDHRLIVWNPDEVQDVDYRKLAENKAALPPGFRMLQGHTDAVRSLSFSDNGKLLVSAGHDNTVRVWNIETGRAIRTFRGHGSWVRASAAAADGRWILSGGYDAQIRRWSIEGGDEIHVLQGRPFEGHANAVLAASFSPDGTQVVTASQDRRAKSWQADSGEVVRTFDEGHAFLASNVVFLADGKRLVTSAMDNTTRIWDVVAGTELFRLDRTGRNAALAVSNDGRRIVTGSDDGAVKIWNTQDGELLQTLQAHSHEVTAVAISNTQPALVLSGDVAGHCILWNADSGEIVRRLSGRLGGHSRRVVAADFLPDGSRVLTASSDHTVAQWNVQNGDELSNLTLRHPGPVMSLQLNADGSRALTGCRDGIVREWDTRSAQVVSSKPIIAGSQAFAENVRAQMARVGWNAATLAERTNRSASIIDSVLNASASVDNEVAKSLATAFGVNSDELLRTVPSSISWTPSGLAAAIAASDRRLLVWDVNSGRDVLDTQYPDSIWAAAFSPDEGRQLAIVGGNEAILVNSSTGDRLITLGPHAAVASASYSADGKRLVTGSWDNSARIWDAATGKDLVKLEGGHSAAINRCAFSPDAEGKYVLTASDDGTAKLWEITADASNETLSVNIVKTFAGHSDRVGFAAFSPDGRFVITTSDDKTARIWDARPNGNIDGHAPLCTLEGHAWAVLCAAFATDSRTVITGGADKSAIIWSLVEDENGQLKASPTLRLEGHTASVTSVAFSPMIDLNHNGRWDAGEPCAQRALTASRDNTVKLWDTKRSEDPAAATVFAKEILTLGNHSREVTSVAFSPDGRRVLTASRDGRAILWHAIDWQTPQLSER